MLLRLMLTEIVSIFLRGARDCRDWDASCLFDLEVEYVRSLEVFNSYSLVSSSERDAGKSFEETQTPWGGVRRLQTSFCNY
jgi:hypothetical protein